MELTHRGLNEKIVNDWIIALMAFIFTAVFLVSLGTDIFYFFLFFSLPGMLLFLLAFYLKRYVGAAAISFISLVLSALMANSSWSWYEENQAIKYYPIIVAIDFFILTLISAKMSLSTHRSKDVLRERLWTIVYNAILLPLLLISLQFTTEVPCGSAPSEFIQLYLPLLLAVIIALIAALLVTATHKCNLINKNSTTNLALSLLFWGIFIAYPSYMYINLAGVGACARISGTQPCTTYIYIGLLIYFTLTTSAGLALLLGKFFCEKSGKKNSS